MGRRALHMLPALKLKNLKAVGRHADGGGLYLQVNEAGNRSWIFRFTCAGRTREMGLGGFPAISLELARKQATQKRTIVALGRDPIVERDKEARLEAIAAANTVSFEEAALECLKRRKAAWRNAKHAQQWENTLRQYAFPVIGDLAVRDVKTEHVMRILDPIWIGRHETATRVRERIEITLDMAGTRGWRDGDNPARWKGHLENLLVKPNEIRKVKAVRHHPALPFAEVGAFMADLRSRPGLAARALELTILTAARTGEVLEAKWAEFDLENAIWVVPAGRIKAGKEHRVPLSPPALSLLRALHGNSRSEFVFCLPLKKRPLSNMAMIKVLARMEKGDITVHGFRSTFRDWAAERTNFSREVAEMALAHSIGSSVEAAYRRGDLYEKRIKLMTAWAAYCDLPNSACTVTAFGRRSDSTRIYV